MDEIDLSEVEREHRMVLRYLNKEAAEDLADLVSDMSQEQRMFVVIMASYIESARSMCEDFDIMIRVEMLEQGVCAGEDDT